MTPSDVKKGVGLAIRQLRDKAGITGDDLAHAMSMTRTAVVQWEHGRNCPPLTKLPRLADALGTSPVRLLALAMRLGGAK